MSVPEENDTPQVDDETRERSSEQRNITAPTPPDVRAKGEDEDQDDGDDRDDRDDGANRDDGGNRDDAGSEPPATGGWGS